MLRTKMTMMMMITIDDKENYKDDNLTCTQLMITMDDKENYKDDNLTCTQPPLQPQSE